MSRPGLRNTEVCPRGQAEAREKGTECLTVDLRQEEGREGGHKPVARSEPASPPPAGGEPRGRLDTTGKRGGQILLHRMARLFGEKNDFFMDLKVALNPTLLT